MSHRLRTQVVALAAIALSAGCQVGVGAPAAAAAPPARAFANPDLPPERRIDDLIAALTLEEKIECLASKPKLPRLGLRLTGHVEGLHGLALGDGAGWGRNQPVPTTTFPQSVGLGETWDPAVVRRGGGGEGVGGGRGVPRAH